MFFDEFQTVANSRGRHENNSRIAIWPIVVLVGVILFVLTVFCYCCCCKKKVKKGAVVRQPEPIQVVSSRVPAPATTSDVVYRYERSVSNSDVYMVPFSALPPNFDYSAHGVEVRGDFVVLKNLSLLNLNTNYEAYRTPAPYNPNVYNPYNQNVSDRPPPPAYTPSLYPNVNEAYQKQAAYNPGYVG